MRTVVNGVTHERDVDPRLLLVDFLRADLGLTGAHAGCDDGALRRLHGHASTASRSRAA